MYHVVASDMDGTLLLTDHTLPPFTKQTLKLLTEKGIHFVFATGRHHVDVAQIRDGMDINAFMITSNGARVHNTAGDLIFSHDLEPAIAEELFRIVYDNPAITTHIYRNDEWYMSKDDPEEQAFYQESVFPYKLFQPGLLPSDGICKVFYGCEDHEQLLVLEEAINARWGDRVNVSFSFPTCLEVMAGGVSKGHALDRVSALMGYSLKDCIAFGDGMNDLEMLSMVGKGCIMSNAHQRLKEKLPQLEVIGTNDEEAVAHYLRHMYLSEK